MELNKTYPAGRGTGGVIVEKIDYHRNGVGGAGFFVALLTHDLGEGSAARMLVISFSAADEPDPEEDYEGIGFGYTGAINLDVIPEYGIEFGLNSWRGADMYEEIMKDAAKEWECDMDRRLGISKKGGKDVGA